MPLSRSAWLIEAIRSSLVGLECIHDGCLALIKTTTTHYYAPQTFLHLGMERDVRIWGDGQGDDIDRDRTRAAIGAFAIEMLRSSGGWVAN